MENIQFNFWSIIILLGAVQGFFLSAYFLLKKENRTSNKWLAFLLIAVSLHLLEYAADITGLTLQWPVLIAITYPLLFLMGPFYYAYCRNLLDKPAKFSYKSILHLLPSLIVLLLMFPFYTMDANTKLRSLRAMTDGNYLKIPVEQLVFMGCHVIQTVVYIFASFKFIMKKKIELKDVSSDVVVIKKLEWLNQFNKLFAVYFLLYFILIVVLSFLNKYQVQFDYILLLIISVSMYAIGYSAINTPDIFKAIPDVVLKTPETDEEPLQEDSEKPEKISELKEKLLYVMQVNKPYLKSDLKISDLANLLSVPAYQLSRLINSEFFVNFYDFINKYRVEEAKKLLIEDAHKYKILSIGYEVGFNSKATFNRVFKKFTNFTPSAFKESLSPSAEAGGKSQT